ncbi:hypothetical protein BS47DRAFT_1379440 [Hydnum rufescens UP504]|uniref:A to I editase domain-containing protein n=1 Tax=Hydnum rufescens UP504 TaxID=1448309 RepID=A0A9P6B7P9_9AGAM|nr:hypothetical protein BS47DRAFT_1379440 [Hydnum rufescens UP504]
MSNPVALACLEVWSDLASNSLRFLRPGQYTILAGFVLHSEDQEDYKCIALGSGTKCLSRSQLPSDGSALHDSHAEVIARRNAILWIIREILECVTRSDYTSRWLHRSDDGRWRLKDHVQVAMYISTLPCGDASMLSLSLAQDEKMAALKSSNQSHPLFPGVTLRGRNNYSALGALRTKPGRADSSASISMSCSDKMASWTVVGLQGALLARIMDPVYIDSVVVGDVSQPQQAQTRIECERAFSLRRPLGDAMLPYPFQVHAPCVDFTDIPFSNGHGQILGNECVSWEAHGCMEVLINGRLRGFSTKAKTQKMQGPATCRASLFALFLRLEPSLQKLSYHEAKLGSLAYQDSKHILRKEGGPLSGWVVTQEDRDGTTS